jgi:uncharacterized membrane protein YhaH (DUF805 family)
MGSASSTYFKWFYFSFRGRTGRQAYWIFMVLPSVLLGVALGIVSFTAPISQRAIVVSFLGLAPVLTWSGAAVSVKRLHDIGVSGWWMIPCFIPYLNFVAAIALGVIRGQTGRNAYGDDPHRREAASL